MTQSKETKWHSHGEFLNQKHLWYTQDRVYEISERYVIGLCRLDVICRTFDQVAAAKFWQPNFLSLVLLVKMWESEMKCEQRGVAAQIRSVSDRVSETTSPQLAKLLVWYHPIPPPSRGACLMEN